jgi:hypothetical protein
MSEIADKEAELLRPLVWASVLRYKVAQHHESVLRLISLGASDDPVRDARAALEYGLDLYAKAKRGEDDD